MYDVWSIRTDFSKKKAFNFLFSWKNISLGKQDVLGKCAKTFTGIELLPPKAGVWSIGRQLVTLQ